jgi:hypothetical protein
MVNNACTVNLVGLPQAAGNLEAVQQLCDDHIISAEIAFLIMVLFNLDQKIANVRMVMPLETQRDLMLGACILWWNG